MGLGSFPSTHELYMGMAGMHGSRTSNMAISESDLLIAVGTRFSDRVISDVRRFARMLILFILILTLRKNKNVNVHYPLIGNIKIILRV